MYNKVGNLILYFYRRLTVHKREILINIHILVISLCVAAILVAVPLVSPIYLTHLLRGCTGWATFGLLAICWLCCIVTLGGELRNRIFAISALTLLTCGYFLYLAFGLEAYKFASSALVFDFGTALVPLGILFYKKSD